MDCHSGDAIKKSRWPCHRDVECAESVGRRLKLLGAEPSWFDESNLIATGSEFTALITLDDHTAAGFDAYHSGTDPAEGG